MNLKRHSIVYALVITGVLVLALITFQFSGFKAATTVDANPNLSQKLGNALSSNALLIASTGNTNSGNGGSGSTSSCSVVSPTPKDITDALKEAGLDPTCMKVTAKINIHETIYQKNGSDPIPPDGTETNQEGLMNVQSLANAVENPQVLLAYATHDGGGGTSGTHNNYDSWVHIVATISGSFQYYDDKCNLQTQSDTWHNDIWIHVGPNGGDSSSDTYPDLTGYVQVKCTYLDTPTVTTGSFTNCTRCKKKNNQ